jgi:hypothetical protein
LIPGKHAASCLWNGSAARNADGSYTPSGVPNERIVAQPNGLLLGAVRERFGGDAADRRPKRTGDEPGRDRRRLQRRLGERHARVARQRAQAVMDGSTNIGTALGFASAGQHVILLDLKDTRPAGFGVGMLVGGQQVPMTTAQTDGTWVAGTSTGHWAVFTASSNTITVNQLDGVAVNVATTLTANSPRTGMATTANSGVGFLAGAGVYVLETAGGEAELGIKLR